MQIFNTIDEAEKNNTRGDAIGSVCDETGKTGYKIMGWDEFFRTIRNSTGYLYEAGWRAEDVDDLKEEYSLTDREAEEYKEVFEELERENESEQ